MTYILDMHEEIPLSIIPESEADEVLQDLYCLISTTIGEVPMYRGYGLDKSYLHMPVQIARTMLTATIAEATAKYMEDSVESVSMSFDTDGDNPDTLTGRIEVTSNE